MSGTTVVEAMGQANGASSRSNARPAPARHRGPARGGDERRGRRTEASSSRSFEASPRDPSAATAASSAAARAGTASISIGDLGEPRVARRGVESAAAAPRRPSNASGKMDGTTVTSASGADGAGAGARAGAGEEDALCRLAARAVAIVAEPDDHRPRVHLVQRFEQDVDALVVERLPRRRSSAARFGEERRQDLRCPRRVPPVHLPGFDQVERALDQVLERLFARFRNEFSTSTPGAPWTRSTWPTTSSSTFGCAPSRRRSRRPARASPSPRREPPRSHASSTRAGAVRLDREARSVAAPTGAPRRTWLQKTRSAGSSSRSCGIGLDEAAPARCSLEQLRLDPRSGRARRPAGSRAGVWPDDRRPAEVVQLSGAPGRRRRPRGRRGPFARARV